MTIEGGLSLYSRTMTLEGGYFSRGDTLTAERGLLQQKVKYDNRDRTISVWGGGL